MLFICKESSQSTWLYDTYSLSLNDLEDRQDVFGYESSQIICLSSEL